MIRQILTLLCMTAFGFVATPGSLAAPDDAELRTKSYERIWQTVNEHHFDPTFGGLDWSAIHDRYLDRVRNVTDDAGFLDITNQMLRELGLSHYAVFKFESGRRRSATDGSIGLETRLLEGQVVITSIREGFPAALAGLRPGYIIKEIDDVPVEEIVKEGEKRALPSAGERGKRANAARAVHHRLFGPPGTSVSLSYLDGSNVPRQSTIPRKKRPGKLTRSSSLPPGYLEFKAERIEGNIGYVRFSPFKSPVDKRFEKAIDGMMNMRGLILDVRGNPGGHHVVGEAIASRLVQKKTLFSIFRYRNTTKNVHVKPREPIYDGPVVVLIDELSASATERFAGCMQSIGRAVVIGERSNGAVGPARVIGLPNGASLYYLIAQSLTPDGVVLEGSGVNPDFTVRRTREALLAGKDLQLERAVGLLSS